MNILIKDIIISIEHRKRYCSNNGNSPEKEMGLNSSDTITEEGCPASDTAADSAISLKARERNARDVSRADAGCTTDDVVPPRKSAPSRRLFEDLEGGSDPRYL